MALNSRLLTLVAAGMLCAVVGAQSGADLLRRSLEARSRTKAVLIQVQSMPGKSSSSVTVKVEMDGAGRMRRTLLQPLRVANSLSIDDGSSWISLAPDEKVARVQPSVDMVSDSITSRMNLIRTNYSVQAARGPEIAGRSTVLLVCRPKSNRELPVRRIFIDQKNFLMLRLELEEPGRAPERLVDTTVAEFPTKVDPDRFKVSVPAGYTVERCTPTVRLTDPQRASKLVGFAPKIPTELPFGFSVEHYEVIRPGPTSGLLALRLSDGFVTLTAYQWASNDVKTRFPSQQSKIIQANGLKMVVIGQLDRRILNMIIEQFTQLLLGSLGPGTFQDSNKFVSISAPVE